MKQKATLASQQLHALSALAQHLSYTSAAKDLGVTQSAVTHSIQSLEGELGVRLVGLVGNRVKFNRLGLKILARARRVLIEMQEIRALANRALQKQRRELRNRMLGGRRAA